jgi:flagellar basal-body rod modification protein FlgD
MDLSTMITGVDYAKLKNQNESLNKVILEGKTAKNNLGKDDFLKILITQLTHQDPTQPMQDKEFVAQMAQFSSLEQMTNLSKEFSKVSQAVASSQAMSLLGRSVEILAGDGTINGVVKEVTGGEYPQLKVNGSYYDYTQLKAVRE